MIQPMESSKLDNPRGAWLVVGATFLMLAVNSGFSFYALGAFSKAYINSGTISLTATSLGASIFLLTNGLGGIPVARWIPKIGIPKIIFVGSLITALCLMSLGSITQAWQLWLVMMVFGLSNAGYALVPGTTMVLARFVGHHPARPLAISAAGLSVGGAICTPLVTSSVESRGIGQTGLIMAIFMMIIVIPIIFIARPPKSVTVPRNDNATNPTIQSTTSTAIKLDSDNVINEVKIKRAFVAVCIAFGLLIMSQVAAISHTLTLGQERGIVNTAFAVSALAAMAVVGRIIGFFVIPHVQLKILSVSMSVLQVTALITIAFSHNLWSLVIGAAMVGLTVGNNQVFIPLWILGLYGIDRYAHMFARANLYTALGVALSPLYIGLTHQYSSGYTTPFLLVAAGSLVAGLFILTLPNVRDN